MNKTIQKLMKASRLKYTVYTFDRKKSKKVEVQGFYYDIKKKILYLYPHNSSLVSIEDFHKRYSFLVSQVPELTILFVGSDYCGLEIKKGIISEDNTLFLSDSVFPYTIEIENEILFHVVAITLNISKILILSCFALSGNIFLALPMLLLIVRWYGFISGSRKLHMFNKSLLQVSGKHRVTIVI